MRCRHRPERAALGRATAAASRGSADATDETSCGAARRACVHGTRDAARQGQGGRAPRSAIVTITSGGRGREKYLENRMLTQRLPHRSPLESVDLHEAASWPCLARSRPHAFFFEKDATFFMLAPILLSAVGFLALE